MEGMPYRIKKDALNSEVISSLMYCRFLVDSLRPSDQIPDLDPHFYCNIRSCFSNG